MSIDEDILPYREALMAITIIEYEKKSNKPIIAIVSADHLSGITKIIGKTKINFDVVDQTKRM